MPSKAHSKKYRQVHRFIEDRFYSISEAIELLPKLSYTQFDGRVEVAFKLGIDPKHSDQVVRNAITLPHGSGSTPRVAVLADGHLAEEARTAGADIVGVNDLIEQIQKGEIFFDRLIATPNLMDLLTQAKVGKVLGPRRLMPNPKLGTVTSEIAQAVREQKMGRVEYRAEKAGIVHAVMGRVSFESQKLKENFNTLLKAILKDKPPTSKGVYLQRIFISATMSPSLKINPLNAIEGLKQ